MRYASPIKNLLPKTGLAVLASLGIHGLLWAVLPGLTLNQADQAPSQRTVGLVQLTPEEQNRLPQVPTVDTELPAFANQPSALPPLPPPPPYQTSVLPPLQLPPGAAPVYNLPPAQNPPPPTQTYRIPLPPPPQTTSFAPIPYEYIPGTAPNRPIPEGNIPSAEPSGQSYPVTGALPPAPQVQPNPPTNNGQLNNPYRNNGQPNLALTPDLTVPADATDQTPQPTVEPSTTPETNPSIQPNQLPARGKQELLALREQIRRRNQSGTTTQPQTNNSATNEQLRLALRQQRDRALTPTQANPRLTDRKALIAALKQQRDRNVNRSNEPSAETKTALANLRSFEAQRARVLAQNPDTVIKPPIRNQLKTCDRSLDGGVAIVGVVVSPEGKLVSSPNLISKTGAADVTQATKYVSSLKFGKTAKPSYYSFNLKFDYDAKTCAQAQPQPTPTSTPQPTPVPRNTNTPQSTPVTPIRSTPQPTPVPRNTNTPQPTPVIPIRRTTPQKTPVIPIQATPQPTITPRRQRRIIVPTPQPTPLEGSPNTRQRTPLTAPTSIPLPNPVRNTPQATPTPNNSIRQLTPSPQSTETSQPSPSNSEPTAD